MHYTLTVPGAWSDGGAVQADHTRGDETAANLHGANGLMDDWTPACLYVKGDTHASQRSQNV